MDYPKWDDTVPIEQAPTQEGPSPASIPESAPSFEDTVSLDIGAGEKLKGGVEAALRGLVSRPVVALGQKALGITPEESQLREAALGKAGTAIEFGAMALPAVLTLGESLAAKAGLAGTAAGIGKIATLGEFTQAGLMSKAGQAAIKKATEKGIESVAAKTALQFGVESALFAAADETAKAIENNPNSVSQAAYNIGLSGLTGGVMGGAIGKVGDLWKTKFTPKYKNFTEDFVGRMKDHARGAIPAADAVGQELQTIVNSADEATGMITGAKGLKRQEVAKLLPDVADEKITNQASKAFSDVSDYLEKVVKEPGTYGVKGTRMIREARDRMLDEVTRPGATAADVFFALDDFKQLIGPLGKFDPRFMGAEKKLGTDAINNLYRVIKTNLEDEAVWGAAAIRQKEINQAASKFFRTVKDLKSVAMSKGPEGEWIVNPDKLNTLINQAKKGKAEIKQNILNNFLDSVDDLYNTIDKIDSKFGISSGIERPAMTASRAVTEKLTPGMKAADYLSTHALDAVSEAGGMALGYEAAKAIGLKGISEWLGTMFGHYQIKPVLKTIMPILIKPITTVGAAGPSIRVASQLINSVASGENLSKLAVDALWLKDKPVKGNDKSSPKHLERLDKQIESMRRNPDSFAEMNNDLSEILPKQSTALSTTTMTALSYLMQKKPYPKQNMPLDRKIEPSKAQMVDYYRTLEIAENPLVILRKIKDGSLKSKDLVDFRSMYPGLYQDLTKKIMSSYADHLAKGGKVDFKVKKGLSLFGMQPLDTSLTPQAIQSAQAVFQKASVPPQQMPAMAPKSSRKSQVPSMTETDSQRRMMNR